MFAMLEKIKNIYWRFTKAQIPLRATALAYHSVLSLVPIIGLILWYLRRIGVTERWTAAIRDFIFSHLNVSSSTQVVSKLQDLSSAVEHKQWGWLGFALFAYTAWNLITKLGDSLDLILETARAEPRLQLGYIKLFLRRLLVMIGLPIAVGVSVIVTTWLRKDSWLRFIFKLKSVGPYLVIPIPWFVDVLVIFLLYHAIPKHPVPWRQSLKAALLVAPFLELGKFGIHLYNTHALTTQKLYGSLYVVPIFIIWVQAAWTIFLVGALAMKPLKQRPMSQKYKF